MPRLPREGRAEMQSIAHVQQHDLNIQSRVRRRYSRECGRPSTIALPLGLGVKLYTGFTDGTLLVSASFASCLQPAVDSVVKHASKVPLDEAWTLHQRRAEEMERQGKQILQALDFDRYVEMSRHEESASSAAL